VAEFWPALLAIIPLLIGLSKLAQILVTIRMAVGGRRGEESVLAVALEARDLARDLRGTVEDQQDRILAVEIDTNQIREKVAVLEVRHRALDCQVRAAGARQ